MRGRLSFANMSKATRTRLLSIGALGAGILFFWLARQIRPAPASAAAPQTGADLAAAVIRLIRADYVEEPNAKTTMEGGFRGMIGSLDVLSSYLDKEAARKRADAALPDYQDIGLILFKRASAFPLVVGVVEGSPAAKAGLEAGDTVSAINDASTILPGLSEIRLLLKSAGADPVKVRIIRNNATKDISVPRGRIYEKSYAFSAQAGTAGVLSPAHFYPPLVDELRKSLPQALAGKTLPLIIDLRYAFEGDNEEARRFINLFVQTEAAGHFEMKGGAKEAMACPDPAPLAGQPLILWVSHATMGPAEIAAACLKELRGAKVVGSLTPGLTARQQAFPLSGGDELLLTTAVFATASGAKVWSKGVTPDVKVEAAVSDRKAYLDKTAGLLARRP